jgi:hypothetical protein
MGTTFESLGLEVVLERCDLCREERLKAHAAQVFANHREFMAFWNDQPEAYCMVFSTECHDCVGRLVLCKKHLLAVLQQIETREKQAATRKHRRGKGG